MKIKKLIIKGFKSFANKTTIEFNDGVTAIVGPNGSGKSNIIESIRWVMGEQSAKSLRGGRMNDVIFSGTEKRHPLNLASVEMIMDNSDHFLPVQFEEVSIMRQITRSGDSGYYINQQECRLRDIIDLFLDSGLGKESFSIISQGQVEAIFNAKSEDRRAIIEEVAGVFKYKMRKEEAERKLDKAQDNLDRVEDIMFELKDQLAPLKKQSANAKQYLKWRQELRGLDIAVTVTQIQSLKEDIQLASDQLQELSKNSSDQSQRQHTLTNQIYQWQEQIDKLAAERDELQSNYLKVIQQIERQTGQLQLFDERQQNKDQTLKDFQSLIDQNNDRLEAINDQLDKIRLEMNSIVAEEKQLNEEIKASDQELFKNDEQLQIELDSLQNNYIDSLQQATSMKNELHYLQQEIQREENAKAHKEEEYTSSQDLLKKYTEQKNEENSHLESFQEDIEHLLTEYQKTSQEFSQKKENFNQLQSQSQNLESQMSRAKAKVKSLSELKDSYSGYYSGVKAVMRQKNNLPGIIGTVADVLTIPETYIQAIDTALGSSSQFIIVDHEQTAQRAINYLKSHRAGRATFLPLNIIKPRYLSSHITSQAAKNTGYIGVASELVKTTEQTQSIIENLLGNILVADTIESATMIARSINYKSRIVTLDGDIIHTGGSMTGGRGRQNNASPIFNQKKELQEAISQVKQWTNEFKEKQSELSHLNDELTQLSEKLEKIQEAGEEKRSREKDSEYSLARLEDQKQNQERITEAIQFELKESKAYLTELKNNTEKIHGQYIALEKDNKQLKQEIEKLQATQNLSAEEKEKLSASLQKLREKSQKYREKIATLRSEQRHLEQESQELKQSNEETKEKISQLKELNDSVQRSEIDQELVTLNEKKSELEKLTEKNQNLSQELAKKEKEAQNELSILRESYEQLSQQMKQIELKSSRNDVKMDHLLHYLADEYDTSFEEEYLTINQDLVTPESKNQVKKLKKSIEQLGSVNLSAIDEYQALSERWEFLTKQQNDLLSAKDQLYETMEQMDVEVETRFKEMFDQVKKQFAIVFPQMFGGGRAELQLTDPDHLLTTGIEIVAQPPGKKLTRLSLLSGGERALTAISLLFAIIQVRPIPFCILDEVESALDDANVARFGAYLQHFNTDTQFIVITHRKGTMEEADRLYGVTMQEKGVSKLVSVSLEEAELMEDVT